MEPSIDTFEDLESELDKLKDEFYSSSGKNTFFKNAQKFECANQIMTQIPIEALLRNTCRVIHTHQIVYIDYKILKSYATPEIFDIITDYIIQVFRGFIEHYGYLEVALNFDTFTVSALERYKNIITIFCDKCFQQHNEFSRYLTTFSIYNVPTMFDTIKRVLGPIVLEEVKSKISLFGKAESDAILKSFGNQI